MNAAMQVTLSDEDVRRVAQAVAELLAPRLAQAPALPPVMTLKDVCASTGMGKTRLLGMIDAGRFPEPFEGGGRGSTMLWRGADVQKWIDSRRT